MDDKEHKAAFQELTDDELQEVSGGKKKTEDQEYCKKCGSELTTPSRGGNPEYCSYCMKNKKLPLI
ncbi:MAG: bacteriocin [Raoultibacter sp.]